MFQKLLKKIANELDAHNIPYMVIGGQAVLLYGEPRLTKDIDITLGVGVSKLNEINSIVEKLNLKILVDKNFVQNTMVLLAIDEKTGIRIDFIFSFSLYEKQAIERATDVKFGNTIVKFASLEDLVIHKIIAGRAIDIEDVKSIILKNPDYNAEYIKKWLQEFDKSLNEKFFKVFQRIVKEIR
ncbi:MAG: nucleotidyltransferase [Actinobacteria bacterium]|jgi:predicted nucleotidyltransferase|nr:nucleotidyltransferase [Actinomycetota bacterium]